MKRRAVAGASALVLACVAGAPRALERPESSDVRQNYVLFCGGCHGQAGTGVRHRVPALRETMPRFLSAQGGRELLLHFPGVANSQLSDHALANVMNWCVGEFAPEAASATQPYTAAEVHAARATPTLNIQRQRAEFMRAAGIPPGESDY
ncbi:MAG: cytochrome c [Proteobacteria bacterium]|nr:cytochrome c [Pseudomonadota bacterium]